MGNIPPVRPSRANLPMPTDPELLEKLTSGGFVFGDRNDTITHRVITPPDWIFYNVSLFDYNRVKFTIANPMGEIVAIVDGEITDDESDSYARIEACTGNIDLSTGKVINGWFQDPKREWFDRAMKYQRGANAGTRDNAEYQALLADAVKLDIVGILQHIAEDDTEDNDNRVVAALVTGASLG